MDDVVSPADGNERMHLIARAFVRQPSGRYLDLLNPRADGWADADLAVGLSRTYRWGGHSVWPLPLSVAQHSLTVLAIAERCATRPLTAPEKLRELLHDADEALIGGFDPISPIKPILGEGYARLAHRLGVVIFERYRIASWSPAEHKAHKHADRLAAASEAVHVAGWTGDEVFDLLNIGLKPLEVDPLGQAYGGTPWEPWPPAVAAQRFLDKLNELQAQLA